MKINVGPQARIVGTKKVNSQGTIGGLREFAGREVLIVLPSRTPTYTATPADLLARARAAAQSQGMALVAGLQAVRRDGLQRRLPRRLVQVVPRRVQPTVRRADAWVRARAADLEKRARGLLQN
jgi:hypothetical protein